MTRVLFICQHNSGRSKMAEAFLRLLGRGDFKAESAGFAPTRVNPFVVRAMLEVGVDLSGESAQKVFDLYRQGRTFDYVITVCADEEQRCPVFPGPAHRLYLPFPDPGKLEGGDEEILQGVREIRDRIRARMQEFVEFARSGDPGALSPQWSLEPMQGSRLNRDSGTRE
jgi:arsenate reductase